MSNNSPTRPGEHSFKKGQKVLVPEAIDSTGHPINSRGHHYSALGRSVSLWRRVTDEEREEWRNDPANGGMDSAGEPRLQSPTVQRVRPIGDLVFTVHRARCTAPLGWKKVSKCVEVVDDGGTHWWVHRRHVFPLA